MEQILLSCPCHIPFSRAQHSAELLELLVLNVSLPAGLVSVGLVSTPCRDPGAVVPILMWLLMVRGTFSGSQFLQWEGCPEFPHHKEWVLVLYCSLLALKGFSGEMNSNDVVIISFPSPMPPQSKYFGSVSSGLWRQTTSEERVLQEGKSELGWLLAGTSPVILAGMIFLLPCDLTLKFEVSMPSRHWLLSWEIGHSPLSVKHLEPLAVSAPQWGRPRSAELHT